MRRGRPRYRRPRSRRLFADDDARHSARRPCGGRRQESERTSQICYRPLSIPLGNKSLARLTRIHLWTDLSTTEIPVTRIADLRERLPSSLAAREALAQP